MVAELPPIFSWFCLETATRVEHCLIGLTGNAYGQSTNLSPSLRECKLPNQSQNLVNLFRSPWAFLQLILYGGPKVLKSFGQEKGVATAVQTIGQGKHKGGVAQGGPGWLRVAHWGTKQLLKLHRPRPPCAFHTYIQPAGMQVCIRSIKLAGFHPLCTFSSLALRLQYDLCTWKEVAKKSQSSSKLAMMTSTGASLLFDK